MRPQTDASPLQSVSRPRSHQCQAASQPLFERGPQFFSSKPLGGSAVAIDRRLATVCGDLRAQLHGAPVTSHLYGRLNTPNPPLPRCKPLDFFATDPP